MCVAAGVVVVVVVVNYGSNRTGLGFWQNRMVRFITVDRNKGTYSPYLFK